MLFFFFFFLILLLLLPTTSALFYNFTFRKSSLCSYVAFSFSRSHLARFSFHLSGACTHTYIHTYIVCTFVSVPFVQLCAFAARCIYIICNNKIKMRHKFICTLFVLFVSDPHERTYICTSMHI